MNRNAAAAALVVGLVLLAGCSSGLTGSPDGTATGESALDGGTTAQEINGQTGTVNMYISDERNAIGDFEHLNVTITRVGVKPAGNGGGADAEDATKNDVENASEDGDADETTEDVTAAESNATDTENATDTADSTETEASDDGGNSDEADESGAGDSKWVEYEVDNRTVDLTELKGANATKLSSLDVPNGSYEKVFVYVSDVNGTLKDGSDQRVKLPSGKLQLNSKFTVGDGEEVDFVFDITAVKAGNSGKYNIKPVISQSGTDVGIDDVDEDKQDKEDEKDKRDEDRSSELNASFDGNVSAGENVTLSVTNGSDPVEGANVFVGGERVGTTDADGAYVIQVPADAEELEVKVTHQGAEAELSVELDSTSDTEEGSNGTQTSNESEDRLTVG